MPVYPEPRKSQVKKWKRKGMKKQMANSRCFSPPATALLQTLNGCSGPERVRYLSKGHAWDHHHHRGSTGSPFAFPCLAVKCHVPCLCGVSVFQLRLTTGSLEARRNAEAGKCYWLLASSPVQQPSCQLGTAHLPRHRLQPLLIRAGGQPKLAAEPHPSRHVKSPVGYRLSGSAPGQAAAGHRVVRVDMLPVISRLYASASI